MIPTTNLKSGLTEREAAERLLSEGPNRFGESRGRSLPEIIAGTLREPMFLLLLGAAALYLVVGDLGEGLFLLAGATLSVGLVIVQELRSEHALAALNALAEPVAQVIREGRPRLVPSSDLVRGDVAVVGEGSRIPADGLLVGGDALTVDESSLTGESVPVTKCLALEPERCDPDPAPGEDLQPNLFAATLIVRGQGVALITGTGARTKVGRIGSALSLALEEPTLLQRDIRRLIRRLGLLALLFCGAVAAAYGIVRGDWLQGSLTGITLAVSLIPEEFPMALAVFLALGAWRLAQSNVLVRRSAVIETLGATTLLCVDKTGTLTENRMKLQAFWRAGRYGAFGGEDQRSQDLLQVAQLASAVRPNDPMDAAIQQAAASAARGGPMRSYPLRPDFLAFVQVWQSPDGRATYAAKGAPETLLPLCGLDPIEAEETKEALRALAAGGMRVLAVADAAFDEDPSLDPASIRYRFQGLLGFTDPVRADVPPAIAEARQAGIEIAMITGDYPATALTAAEAAGIDTAGGVLTGAQIAQAADPPAICDKVRVFARVSPEQKLVLVNAFRGRGEVVAMTGDGINDAPALAAADIGIAMGRRGTDVAREASDLILLDDRFASIIGGIRLGRRIFANLRKAMTFIAAIHVPVAGLALLPILLGLPPLLFPMHVVLLELLIDPLCSLVFEGEPSRSDAMSKPPRPALEPLFGGKQLALAALQGAILLIAVLALYAWMIHQAAPEPEARAAAFIALVAGDLSLALAEASAGSSTVFDSRRIAFWAISGIAAATLLLCLNLPALAAILRFSPPDPSQLLAALAIGGTAGGWYRLLRRAPEQAVGSSAGSRFSLGGAAR